MKHKAISVITSLFTALITVVANPSTAFAMPRDPNGDGIISLTDSVLIYQYLAGNALPSDLTSLDIDQNGIISVADAHKKEAYDAGYTSILPEANANDPIIPGYASSVTYLRHDCSSSSHTSYSTYTVNAPSITLNQAPDEINTIIDHNDMQRDLDTAVVRINITSVGSGSGFIVGPHTIATAAHCVYSGTQFYDMSISVVDTDHSILTTVTPDYLHIPYFYYTASNPYTYDAMCYDYALIYVSEDLSQYGTLKLGVALDQYIEDEGDVYVSGFPGTNGYPSGFSQDFEGMRFYAPGNVTDGSGDNTVSQIPFVDRVLFYDADTYGGDSGGPVYVLDSYPSGNTTVSEKIVIGIHTNGFNATNNIWGFNKGTRVNEELLRFYYQNTHLVS